jgi:hypothetical protein
MNGATALCTAQMGVFFVQAFVSLVWLPRLMALLTLSYDSLLRCSVDFAKKRGESQAIIR